MPPTRTTTTVKTNIPGGATEKQSDNGYVDKKLLVDLAMEAFIEAELRRGLPKAMLLELANKEAKNKVSEEHPLAKYADMFKKYATQADDQDDYLSDSEYEDGDCEDFRDYTKELQDDDESQSSSSKDASSSSSSSSLSPFHQAVTAGDVPAVQAAVDLGADVNSTSGNGDTALHMCITKNDTNMLTFLLSIKSDPNIANKAGHTPLHSACVHGFFELVKILIDAGSDVNILNTTTSHTPLHTACMYGNLDIIKCLVENQANINAVSEQGDTPLHAAVGENSIEVVKCLVALGADLTIANKAGKTAYDIANWEISEILEKSMKKKGGKGGAKGKKK